MCSLHKLNKGCQITFNCICHHHLFVLMGWVRGNGVIDLEKDTNSHWATSPPVCTQPKKEERVTLEPATFITDTMMLGNFSNYFLRGIFGQLTITVSY